MSPVPPRVTCATIAVRRWILVTKPKIDGERQLHLLAFAQSEIFCFDEHAVGAQVFGLANSALAAGHHHVHRCARAVAGVQATLHPYVPFRLIVVSRHYAHRHDVSEVRERGRAIMCIAFQGRRISKILARSKDYIVKCAERGFRQAVVALVDVFASNGELFRRFDAHLDPPAACRRAR